MDRWYYARQREKVGPVTSEQMHDLAQRGELRPSDMVIREGGQKWFPAESIPNLFGSHSAPTNLIPPPLPPPLPPAPTTNRIPRKLKVLMATGTLLATGLLIITVLWTRGFFARQNDGERQDGQGAATSAEGRTHREKPRLIDQANVQDAKQKDEPPPIHLTRRQRAAELTEKAAAALRAQEFASAVVIASEAIELDDKNAAAYFIRGSAYFWIGNLAGPNEIVQCERGAQDFRRANSLDPAYKAKTEKLLRLHEEKKVLLGIR